LRLPTMRPRATTTTRLFRMFMSGGALARLF
jgi:hypothetical protein